MEYLYEKYGKTRVYWVLVLMLVVFNILVFTITYQFRIRFYIGSQSFKYVSSTYDNILFQDNDGNNVAITMHNSTDMPVPFSLAPKYEINYLDKVIKCDSTDWAGKGEIIMLSDGSTYIKSPISVVDGWGNSISALPYDMQLVNGVNSIYRFIKRGNLFWWLMMTIPLILLGLFNFVFPQKMWRFRYALVVSGGEPTEISNFFYKLGGILLIGFAMILPVIIK